MGPSLGAMGPHVARHGPSEGQSFSIKWREGLGDL